MAYLRDRNGKFAPGTQGGPGRPPLRVEREYLGRLKAACPPDTWERICRKAAEAALMGEPKAREWLSRYLLGDATVKQLDPPHTPDETVAGLCEALGVPLGGFGENLGDSPEDDDLVSDAVR